MRRCYLDRHRWGLVKLILRGASRVDPDIIFLNRFAGYVEEKIILWAQEFNLPYTEQRRHSSANS